MQIAVTIRRVHVNLPKLGEGGACIANILCTDKYILFSLANSPLARKYGNSLSICFKLERIISFLLFFFFLIRILNYAARDVKNNTLRIYLPVRVIRSWKIVRYSKKFFLHSRFIIGCITYRNEIISRSFKIRFEFHRYH